MTDTPPPSAVVQKAREWLEGGDGDAVRLVHDLLALVESLQRDRDNFGPLFIRDLERLARVPEGTSLDELMECLRALVEDGPHRQALVTLAERKGAPVPVVHKTTIKEALDAADRAVGRT